MWLVTGFLLLVALPVLSAETIKVADALKDAEEGQSLGGMVLHGNIVWESNGIKVVKEGNQKYLSFDKPSEIGKFLAPQDATSIRLEAKFHAVKLANRPGGAWLSIGFGDPESKMQWEQGVMALVNDQGGVQCFYKQDGKLKAIAGTKSVSPDGCTTLAVEYNKTENVLTILLDGAPVVDHVNLSKFNFTPAMDVAGISSYAVQTGDKSVKDISVEIVK